MQLFLAIALLNFARQTPLPTPLTRPSPEPAITFSEGLATPESVLYDPETDVYLISNINGPLTARDNNGFITLVSPDGKHPPVRLIEGGKGEATLNAPKGMALIGNLLYVADIDTVRIFDRRSGRPRGEVKVPGGSFVNDLVASADGKAIYLTDSGFKEDREGELQPTGSDAVYVLKNKKLFTLIKDPQLGFPNGIAVLGESVWIANLGDDQVWSIDLETGRRGASFHAPRGMLDGIVALPDGTLLISSWEGKAIYRGKPGGELKEVFGSLGPSPADLGYDSKRNRVLVPRTVEDKVEAYELTSSAPAASAR